MPSWPICRALAPMCRRPTCKWQREPSDMVPGLITAVLLLLFVGGCIWLWRPGNKPALDAAAQMPLDDDKEGTA
ncbi:cbb3-type cytochrome c oxidase subunit 3 [Dyella silvae]|uniref:cbb3-type cytochrome oxidase subunit 3 n=1 Tax=Dyella silvae TaxID=2994424 RepID=UPI002B2713E5|nr:cbb3-type cytochrome c oxidase subunit 3 [Dyella silvae]